MTKKKAARNLGKHIRSATGVPLPVAMQAAKLIVRSRAYELRYTDKSVFVGFIKYDIFCECCGPENWRIEGPRGDYGI